MDEGSIFLDTNVLLDILLGREVGKASDVVFGAASAKGIKMYISAPGLATAFYIAQRVMPMRVAYDLVASIYPNFDVVDQDKKDVDEAFALPIPDLEDALQYQAARKAKCMAVLSRDIAFQNLGLTEPEVLSPEIAFSRFF